MYKPDRVILRKIKEYCPYLFVEWNNRRRYFEIWIHMPHGRRLVTPVTRSIFELDCSDVTYTPLDERILWWLYASDGYRQSNVKLALLEEDRRYQAIEQKMRRDFKTQFREMGMDMWNSLNSFYTTKHSRKNAKPTFNHTKQAPWLRPDIQSTTSPRLFYRSKGNARAYGRFQ